MDVKYQIFVSSTYADLVDERRSVMRPFLTSGIFLWGWRHSKPATTLNGITLSGASITATTTYSS
ncbi:MAG: DUF4062 domain-containing protein [Mesorhizobium sp.]|nr:MAG: DUF4062 domain-containing protein [Mesorhizobium sp.]